jgi:hypothetical protein
MTQPRPRFGRVLTFCPRLRPGDPFLGWPRPKTPALLKLVASASVDNQPLGRTLRRSVMSLRIIYFNIVATVTTTYHNTQEHHTIPTQASRWSSTRGPDTSQASQGCDSSCDLPVWS